MSGSEYYLAIPSADGGLELVHARPALVWADAGPAESAEAVVQEWLVKLNRKGKVTP